MPEAAQYPVNFLQESVHLQIVPLCREYENWMSSSILADKSKIRDLANLVEIAQQCSHIEALRLVRIEIERAAIRHVALRG